MNSIGTYNGRRVYVERDGEDLMPFVIKYRLESITKIHDGFGKVKTIRNKESYRHYITPNDIE